MPSGALYNHQLLGCEMRECREARRWLSRMPSSDQSVRRRARTRDGGLPAQPYWCASPPSRFADRSRRRGLCGKDARHLASTRSGSTRWAIFSAGWERAPRHGLRQPYRHGRNRRSRSMGLVIRVDGKLEGGGSSTVVALATRRARRRGTIYAAGRPSKGAGPPGTGQCTTSAIWRSWCDGIAPHALVEHEGIRPDFVVIGEPTLTLNIYRGHRGRIEVAAVEGQAAPTPPCRISATIRSIERRRSSKPSRESAACPPIRSSAPGRSRSPTYGRHPLAERRARCGRSLSRSPCHTLGDTARRRAGCDPRPAGCRETADYQIPLYRGAELHRFRLSGRQGLSGLGARGAIHPLLKRRPRDFGRSTAGIRRSAAWNFSTNGIYWMGKANIPSIGFGPGDEAFTPTPRASRSPRRWPSTRPASMPRCRSSSLAQDS